MTDARLHLGDGYCNVGDYFYWYNASAGKIVKQIYMGEYYLRSRFMARRAALTPQRAAMLGRRHARSLSGIARVKQALKDYERGT